MAIFHQPHRRAPRPASGGRCACSAKCFFSSTSSTDGAMPMEKLTKREPGSRLCTAPRVLAAAQSWQSACARIDGHRVLTGSGVQRSRNRRFNLLDRARFHRCRRETGHRTARRAGALVRDHYDHLCRTTMTQLATMTCPIVSASVRRCLGKLASRERIIEQTGTGRRTSQTFAYRDTILQHFLRAVRDDPGRTLADLTVVESEHASLLQRRRRRHRSSGSPVPHGPFESLVMLEIGAFHQTGSITSGPRTRTLAAFAMLGGAGPLPSHSLGHVQPRLARVERSRRRDVDGARRSRGARGLCHGSAPCSSGASKARRRGGRRSRRAEITHSAAQDPIPASPSTPADRRRTSARGARIPAPSALSCRASRGAALRQLDDDPAAHTKVANRIDRVLGPVAQVFAPQDGKIFANAGRTAHMTELLR